MTRMGKWVLFALAGCAAPEASLPLAEIPLRNPTVTVASQSDVTLGRLAGTWTIVEGAGVVAGSALRVTSDTIVLSGVVLPLRGLGNGRFRMGDETLWVHWLDFDNRTAALGNPDGSRVWIMDRIGAPGERLDVGREILEWYGYDMSRLQAALD